MHGKCNATTYECDCDLGYTGPDCSTDCQCNHQSMCSRGIGICDACQENTGGSNCQYCLPGYYGNPSEGKTFFFYLIFISVCDILKYEMFKSRLK